MAAKKDKPLNITRAKGRPMLNWVGKRSLSHITSFPAQHIETFENAGRHAIENPEQVAWEGWPSKYPKGGLLFHGDNKEVMAHLLSNGFRGRVNLVYIDPPFDSGADYIRKIKLRGIKGTAKLEGENYSLGEQIQYTDIWANDNYLQWLYERIQLIKELVSEGGSLLLHCDNRRVHHIRCILDEVFSADNFVNEIIWQHQIMGGSHDMRFPKAHETILWYANKDKCFHLRSEDPNVRVPYSDYVKNTLQPDENGRQYYERRRMSRKATDEEAASKAHTRTYVDDIDAGTVATDVWTDMLSYQELPNEREGLDLYPTQKTSKLLTRIISAASDPGDIIMDCFCGSGVAMKVAQKLGRRWIGCDINKGAIQTTANRLQVIINEHIRNSSKATQSEFSGMEMKNKPRRPMQYSFTVWRVNDYDLQIQHNEAVNLAAEHIGILRLRTDNYFDGTHGRSLCKIIPFGHPLTPLDLEELKRELNTREDEDRNITLVCLGMELASKTWIDEWNRLRKGSNAVNRIDIIELRTDPKYGKFIEHKPAITRIKVTRGNKEIKVEIQDFISPTILERLDQQCGVVAPKIEDWRQTVNSVMIDTAYDGKVFNIILSDVPEKKDDLVCGKYSLPAIKGETMVAVKITDMLGEEVISTYKV